MDGGCRCDGPPQHAELITEDLLTWMSEGGIVEA